MTVSVQSATPVTKSDDSSVAGVAVDFTVVNNGTSGLTISNTFSNFTLQFGNGDTADHSYAQFVDSSGQDVPCLRGDPVSVNPGQQTSQEICFELPNDESGQTAKFAWNAISPANFSIAIGTLR